MTGYLWYSVVDKEEQLLQGDIIDECPVIVPSNEISKTPTEITGDVIEYRVIVMSQSCDLINKKLDLVLVCPIWNLTDFIKDNPDYKPKKRLEGLRRGYYPGYHLLNKCNTKGFESDYQVVDFRYVFSVPCSIITNIASKDNNRLRLMPPYREHLSQAFSRFFMRVGLPADIPSFR